MCKAVRAGTRAGHWRLQQRQDVTGAWLYLRGRPDVIPDRIGLWSGSYGGYLTALGLAHASDLFRATCGRAPGLPGPR